MPVQMKDSIVSIHLIGVETLQHPNLELFVLERIHLLSQGGGVPVLTV